MTFARKQASGHKLVDLSQIFAPATSNETSSGVVAQYVILWTDDGNRKVKRIGSVASNRLSLSVNT